MCCNAERRQEIIKLYREIGIPFELSPVYSCNKYHLEGKLCVCDIYETRPAFCKEWPTNRRDLFGLPECGYKFD